MRFQYHGHFDCLSFPKKGSEVKARARKMHEEATSKAAERKKRIEAIAKEMGLDDAMDVLTNIDKISRGASDDIGGRKIQSGNSAAMRDEIVAMKRDEEEAGRLRLIADNLPDNETFNLKFAELEYFGF